MASKKKASKKKASKKKASKKKASKKKASKKKASKKKASKKKASKKNTKTKSYETDVVLVKQRQSDDAPKLFLAAVPARDIMGWAEVVRVEEREKGIQRRLSSYRMRNVTRFFDSDDRNVSPTAVVVAFRPGSVEVEDDEPGALVRNGRVRILEPETKPGFIVDGQHRVFGASKAQDDIQLIVVGLLDADETEQAFQFVVINNKVARVPPDTVRALLSDYREDELQERLSTARISIRDNDIEDLIQADTDEYSPFFSMLDWERRRGEGQAVIKPRTILHCVKFIKAKLPEFKDDDETVRGVLFSVWSGVRGAYDEAWIYPEDSGTCLKGRALRR